VDSSNQLAQDNANFFWDATNHRIGIGTTSPSTQYHSLLADSTTNVSATVMTLAHNSSGTPAASFGSQLAFVLKTSTTNNRDAVFLRADWATATEASQKGRLTVQLSNNGTMTTRFVLTNTGIQTPIVAGNTSSPLVCDGSGNITSFSGTGNGILFLNGGGDISNSGQFGFATSSGVFSISPTNSTTNTVNTYVTFVKNSSGTPAAGFGFAIQFSLKSSTTNDNVAAVMDVRWTDATHASRTSAMVFSTVNNGASSASEVGRFAGLSFRLSGGISLASPATKGGTYTMTESDTLVLADATGAAFAVTLVAANLKRGFIAHIKKIDNVANNITVTAGGGDSIEGAGTYVLTAQYKSVTLWADGANTWYIISAT
jgi:hypothetical protein